MNKTLTFHKMIEIDKEYDIANKKLIGNGAYGVIYKCEKKKIDPSHDENEFVAIKYIPINGTFSFDRQKMCYREISTQLNLDHIAILPLLNYQIILDPDPQFAIVTPYLNNKSLRDILDLKKKNQAPKNWTDTECAINIFGIAAAMAYCHQKGIMHRDLKTSNVLLDNDFHPKIMDFGLAKEINLNILQTIGIGSPIYMAPEVITADGKYDNKIDVFSYALILYEIFTLEIPYYNQKFSLMQYMKGNIRPELGNHKFPPYFKDIIQVCWNENPNDRPDFIEIVKDMKTNYKTVFGKDNMDDVDLEQLSSYMEIATKDLIFSE